MNSGLNPADPTLVAAFRSALAVSGSYLTVWRLAGTAAVWSKIQTIDVPLQYGSSS